MIDINNSKSIINEGFLDYVYIFEKSWIPMLDNMGYNEIIQLIAKLGRSKIGSSSFSWAFLMHSYLVYYRLSEGSVEKRTWDVLGEVSFEFDYSGVRAFENYIERMEYYLELQGGSMWDFEHLKEFPGCPEIDD